jgi:hypothetical protein
MLKKHHFDDLGKYGRIILKQDLQGVVWEGVVWINLVQNIHIWPAVAKKAMSRRLSYDESNFLSSLGRIAFSRSAQLH